ncbi:hypothetical protein AB3Y40_00065 [Yoonia sp. R2331]|uniref:hypothetical protein n=1 Tax=Yoonia sp. R2331 TaxID=3237238 RepID=UPI0034E54AA5
MADLIRPELRAGLWRWRESLLGLAVVALGAWWLNTFYSPVQWIGWAIGAGGLVWAAAGWQRARFRATGDGPGVVQINERRLAYFGPLTGGVIDIADMSLLELEPKAVPAPHWVISGIGGQSLAIPVNATNADALFDAFASLPGIRTQSMLDVLSRTPDARVTIWRRNHPALH